MISTLTPWLLNLILIPTKNLVNISPTSDVPNIRYSVFRTSDVEILNLRVQLRLRGAERRLTIKIKNKTAPIFQSRPVFSLSETTISLSSRPWAEIQKYWFRKEWRMSIFITFALRDYSVLYSLRKAASRLAAEMYYFVDLAFFHQGDTLTATH